MIVRKPDTHRDPVTDVTEQFEGVTSQFKHVGFPAKKATGYDVKNLLPALQSFNESIEAGRVSINNDSLKRLSKALETFFVTVDTNKELQERTGTIIASLNREVDRFNNLIKKSDRSGHRVEKSNRSNTGEGG